MANHRKDTRPGAADYASSLIRDRKAALEGAGGQRPSAQDQRQSPGRHALYVLGVVVVICLVAAGILLAANLLMDEDSRDLLSENAYVSPLDWSKLDRTDGRYAYVEAGSAPSRVGIDVSENQHAIDWGAVAADGIDFAMVRLGYRGATEGDLYLDAYYEANMAGAQGAGLERGIYFFSQAITPEEAVEEAEFVLAHLDGAALDYPIAFDSEEHIQGVANPRTSPLDKPAMTAVADAFCERIEEAGYEVMVYGNAHDMSRYRRSSMDHRLIWFAEYGAQEPHNKLDIVMWQYSNAGTVAGIEGAVDMNLDLRPVLDSQGS